MTTITPAPTKAAFNEPREACNHEPTCPTFDNPDHDAARIVASHHEQGWILLCNGVVVFDDTSELVGSRAIAPHRPQPQRRATDQS